MGILRSPAEIRFRLRQELVNLRLLALPPLPPAPGPKGSAGFPALPPPQLAATSHFAAQCLLIANQILQHRFPLLGATLETGEKICWRRDYQAGLETPTVYFRRLPYLDVTKAGDHKNIWELNRHQHLVLLAQAYRLSGESQYLDEIVRELESWWDQNPFQRGINWTSALEVAFRALSWIWIDHLAGARLEEPFRQRLLAGLYQHGLHLEVNLSHYFSPNTHLLGEAVALHAIGLLYPQFSRARRWEKLGARVVRSQLDRQVLADGCYFELSPYYHVYALDMFLFHSVLIGLDSSYRDTLTRMASFLHALLGVSGILPMLGDDDGGRFFHPYGPRDRFGLATLATCGVYLDRPEWIRDPRHLEEQAAWWLGARSSPPPPAPLSPPPAASVRFPDCGLVVMAAGDVQVIVDAGTFGPGSAGHSHADTLSVVVRKGGEPILVDPGTYTYVGDPAWRDWFRGTAAHNTVRIDGRDQAIARGPFAWQSRPEVAVLAWETSPDRDRLVAACSYAGFRHERTVVLDKEEMRLVITDRISGGGPGPHRIEQFWHLGSPGVRDRMTFEPPAQPLAIEGWISPTLGVKFPAPALCVELQTSLPATLQVTIALW